jgi:hypothetical protein
MTPIPLAKAVAELHRWKQVRGTHGRCLEGTWHVCEKAGVPIAGGRTAWDSFLSMKAHSATYDYEPAARDAHGRLAGESGRDGYCLVYFSSKWPRTKPGHIGILHNNVIYSDVDYPMPRFAKRLRGAFVPRS